MSTRLAVSVLSIISRLLLREQRCVRSVPRWVSEVSVSSDARCVMLFVDRKLNSTAPRVALGVSILEKGAARKGEPKSRS